MADVLFITPNIDGNRHEEPFGTLLLGTILRQSGIAVDILQFYHFGKMEDFGHFLKRAVTMTLEKAPRLFPSIPGVTHTTLCWRLLRRSKNISLIFGSSLAAHKRISLRAIQ